MFSPERDYRLGNSYAYPVLNIKQCIYVLGHHMVLCKCLQLL